MKEITLTKFISALLYMVFIIMVLIEHLFYLFFCTTFPLTHTNTSCNSWLLSQTSNNASFVVLSLPSMPWAPLPSLLARFPRQPV